MTESDDWDELNRELGVSKPAPGADEPAAEDAEAELPEAELLAEEAGDAEDAGDAEGGEEAENGAEGGPDEGQPGTGRKRRRRRRRKKKGPGEGLAPAEAGDPAGEEEEREPAPTPAPRRQPVAARAATPEYAEAGEDEGEDEGVDAAGETLAAEEDAGGELLRDLIANWDVPAWDQVIGGLHRPGR